MQFNAKTSKMHANKTFEMNEGIGGNGSPVWLIFTMIAGICKHQEMFKSEAEAKSWWNNACN